MKPLVRVCQDSALLELYGPGALGLEGCVEHFEALRYYQIDDLIGIEARLVLFGYLEPRGKRRENKNERLH